MSITIPQAGSVAGRSADIRGLDQQPDLGGFVADVGAAVAQKMGEVQAKQRAVVVENTRLDMTKELGEERLRFEQMTDPAQIEAEWPEVQARIQEKYINGKDENGKPLLSPEEAQALGLTFKDLGMKHGFALGERTIKLTDSQAVAAWDAARLDIVNTAATADPDTMAALIDMGEAAIDRLPGLMPDERQKQKSALRGEVANARATTALDQDPIAFIEAAEAGTYDELGPERVAQLKVTAQAEADRRAAADAKLTEAELKKRDDAIGDRLTQIGDLTSKGRKVSDVDYVRNPTPEVKANPKYPAAAAAVALADEIPDLNVKTVAELDALIAQEEKREITHDWEHQRLPVLKALRDKKAEALATDPKSALTDIGAPPLPEFDPADPDSFAAALREAVSFDGWQREKGYSEQQAIFSKSDKASLQAVLAPGADAGPKVALMGAILQGTGGNPTEVLAALEADPVTRRAAKVLGVTQDARLTEAILRGSQKLDGKTVVPPSRKEQILAFDQMTGGVFDDVPALKAELMEATLALYADGAAGIDGETTAADKSGLNLIADESAYTLYQQSVQRLLGAQADRNGDLTVGGLQEVNGGLTVLPVGVAVQDVEDGWQLLTDQLNGRVYDAALNQTGDMAGADPSALREGFAAPIPEAADPLRAFKTASLYGGVPDLGKSPGQRFQGLTLRRVGETDVYELVREQNGRLIPVPEVGKDYAYRFRLKDLMRGARQ